MIVKLEKSDLGLKKKMIKLAKVKKKTKKNKTLRRLLILVNVTFETNSGKRRRNENKSIEARRDRA